jgi:hypothetical protein
VKPLATLSLTKREIMDVIGANAGVIQDLVKANRLSPTKEALNLIQAQVANIKNALEALNKTLT